MDAHQLEHVQATVEQACIHSQHPANHRAAEATLLQFRQSSRPIAACQYILTRSALPEARFHAALTLREAALREWAVTPQEGTRELRSFVLQAILAMSDEPAMQVARGALIAALALIAKRGWLQEDLAGRNDFLQGMQAAVNGRGTAAAQQVGLQIMEALVTQFSVATASPLGLPLEYHEQCCRDFEAHFLRGIFRHASSLAQQAASSGAAIAGTDAGACGAAMDLLAAVLAWDFQRPLHAAPGSLAAQAARVAAESATAGGATAATAPDEAWASVLLDPSSSEWLVQLLESLSSLGNDKGAGGVGVGRSGSSGSSAEALAAQARQLLVVFCSFRGEDVFPREAQAASPSPARLAYLRQMLRAVLRWVAPAEQVLQVALPGRQEQLVDACRAIAALAPTHKATALDAAAAALVGPAGPTFTQLLQQLTLALLSARRSIAAGEAEDWMDECADMLIESWAALVQPDYRIDGGAIPPATADAAAHVFAAVAEDAMRDAARGAHEDAVDEDEAAGALSQDDHMGRIASLARAAPLRSFPFIAYMLDERRQLLLRAVGQGGQGLESIGEVLEQLCWLLRAAAFCLADSGAGETPMVPLAVSTALEASSGGSSNGGHQTVRGHNGGNGGMHGVGSSNGGHANGAAMGAAAAAVQRLCHELLEVPLMALAEGMRGHVSPRLMEVGIWALARWSDTYLFPEESLPAALQPLYSTASSGPPGQSQPTPAMQLLDRIVRVANNCLVSFPGEAELHRQVITSLLPVLVRRRPLCEQVVITPAWHELAGAFASRQPVLVVGLGAKLQRSLSQALCSAAIGLADEAVPQYVSDMLRQTVAEVQGLASQPNLSDVAGRADVVLQLSALLECLRGAHLDGLSRTQPVLWALCEGLLQPLLLLYSAFAGEPAVTALVLKLAGSMVECHVAQLQVHQANMQLAWVLQLLQRYSRGTVGSVLLLPAAGSGKGGASASAKGQASKRTGSSAVPAGTRSGSMQSGPDPAPQGTSVTGRGGQVTAAGVERLREAKAADSARELRALVQLLIHVTKRDLAEDFALTGPPPNTENGVNLSVAQVVLFGLDILTPLMSPTLLAFPKLCNLFFSLLAYTLEQYSWAVATLLPQQRFSPLMSTLAVGLRHTEVTVVGLALDGLSGLAHHHHRSLQSGAPGFSHHMVVAPEGNKPVIAYFLELLLRRLLLENDAPADLADMAANALLPLLLSDLGTFRALGSALVQAQTDSGSQARIAAALQALMPHDPASGGAVAASNSPLPTSFQPIVADLSRNNVRVFRAVLCRVVAEVRGLVQVR